MPNTVPQTTTLEALNDKFERAAHESHVNYSFFPGATASNLSLIGHADAHRIPGIEPFMGASTGNMLVDGDSALGAVFAACAERGLPLMTHCREDSAIINVDMARAKVLYGDDPDIEYHPTIRSEEACWQSTHKAVSLARRHHTRLHVAHITTARELELFGADDHITAEAVAAHLLFSDSDYAQRGALIKCNPAVKTAPRPRCPAPWPRRRSHLHPRHRPRSPPAAPTKQGGCARAGFGHAHGAGLAARHAGTSPTRECSRWSAWWN